MNDVMIDLETLSTRHDAAILSIGACLFDIETGEIGTAFHRHIELDDSPLRGHISADTVKWRIKQDDAARQSITNNGIRLSDALADLINFCPRSKSTKLWSNGATFDLIIDGKLAKPDDYAPLHDYWDTIGGAERIANDMNHFSFEHNGYR